MIWEKRRTLIGWPYRADAQAMAPEAASPGSAPALTAFSLVTKAAFVVLAVLGMATLWMAVFDDMGASLLVVLNGLRALRVEEQPPTIA